MQEAIIHIDKYLFKLINTQWHNDFFDIFMPLIRNSKTHIPLYLFLFFFVLINYKKTGKWWLAFAVLLPVCTDFISSMIIKEKIFRLRPCNDPEMADSIRFLLNYRPESSSFTSSHATSHFGMASFYFFTLRNSIGKISSLFFIWAALVCYAQIYVGVHYPLDVICGGIIGLMIGYLASSYFNKKFVLY